MQKGLGGRPSPRTEVRDTGTRETDRAKKKTRVGGKGRGGGCWEGVFPQSRTAAHRAFHKRKRGRPCGTSQRPRHGRPRRPCNRAARHGNGPHGKKDAFSGLPHEAAAGGNRLHLQRPVPVTASPPHSPPSHPGPASGAAAAAAAAAGGPDTAPRPPGRSSHRRESLRLAAALAGQRRSGGGKKKKKKSLRAKGVLGARGLPRVGDSHPWPAPAEACTLSTPGGCIRHVRLDGRMVALVAPLGWRGS